MNKTKFFHYVPQFYLRNFSIPDKENMIWCFDKVTSKAFIADIRNMGCAKDFYDENSEKHLSSLESQISPVYRKLVKTGDLASLNWSERIIIATFIAIQDTRTQEGRIALKEVGETLIGKIVETMPASAKKSVESTKNLSKIVQEKAEVLAKETQITMLKEETMLFADILLGLQWILMENKSKTLLWTSDNPVNKYNPIKPPHPYLGNLGYYCAGIEIFLPLSPSLCLCLCDLGTHKLVPSEKMVMLSKQNVIFQNYFQLAQSSRHIFSQNGDYSLATKILKDQPSLRDPLRKRVISS